MKQVERRGRWRYKLSDMKQETSLRVVIVMGVSGSGKSTIAEQLADSIRGVFFDADDFHPKANVEKMANGHALNDEDRMPWLERLKEEVVKKGQVEEVSVLACSALKKSYREILGGSGVVCVYLHGSRETLLERMEGRQGHFMKADMLDSQLADLEAPEPDEAIIVEITKSPEAIVEEIISRLGIENG